METRNKWNGSERSCKKAIETSETVRECVDKCERKEKREWIFITKKGNRIIDEFWGKFMLNCMTF